MTFEDPFSPEALRTLVSAVASRGHTLRWLEATETQTVIDSLAHSFVADTPGRWWWSRLRPPTLRIAYGSADGLVRLEELLADTPEPLYLMITADEPPPWTTIEGSLTALVTLLKELPCCEFLVTNRDRQWVVFDTHHNALVVAGSLASKPTSSSSIPD